MPLFDTLPELARFGTVKNPLFGPQQTVFTDPAAPAPAPPGMLDQLGESGMGLISTVGDILDRPDAALRAMITGDPDAAWRALVPFGETLGIYRPEHRVSGADVNRALLGLESFGDEGLFSGPGMAGLGTEMLLSLYNIIPGLGALMKSGKAARLVGQSLKSAERMMPALQAGRLTDYAKLAPEALGGARQVGPATALTGPLAEAGQFLRREGLPLELAEDWGEAARLGQRALLPIGGEFSPLPGLVLGQLPEAALLRAPAAVGAMQRAGQWLGAAPGIKHIGQLFARTPPGLEGDAARAFTEELDAARALESAEMARATEQAAGLEAAMRAAPPATPPAPGQVAPPAAPPGPPTAVMEPPPPGTLEAPPPGQLEAPGQAFEPGVDVPDDMPLEYLGTPQEAEWIARQQAQATPPPAATQPAAAPTAPAAAPPAPVQVPFQITRDMEQQLLDLGYSRADVGAMTPEAAHAALRRGAGPVPEAAAPGLAPEAAPPIRLAKTPEQAAAEARALQAAPPEPPATMPRELIDPETGEMVTVPGPEKWGTKATSPEYIKRQFAEAREELTKPVRERAEREAQQILTEAEERAELLTGGPRFEQIVGRAKVGDKVYFVPKGGRFKQEYPGRVTAIQPDGRLMVEPLRQPKVVKKHGQSAIEAAQTGGIPPQMLEPGEVRLESAALGRRRRAAELEQLPPEMRAPVKEAGRDANLAIDAIKEQEIQMQAALEGGTPREMGLARAEAREEYVTGLGLEPGVKGKAAALPPALEEALEMGLRPGAGLPQMKSVQWVNADLAELMPGDQIRLGGDTFRVQEATEAGTIKLKDGWELEVPDEAVPIDRGSEIGRAGAPPTPPPKPGELLPEAMEGRPMVPAEYAPGQKVSWTRGEKTVEGTVVKVHPKHVEFDVPKGRDIPRRMQGRQIIHKGSLPPAGPPVPKPYPTPAEWAAEEARRVKARGAQESLRRRHQLEKLPPELQEQVKGLEAQEAAALRAAEYSKQRAAAEAAPPTPSRMTVDLAEGAPPRVAQEVRRVRHQLEYTRQQIAKTPVQSDDWQRLQAQKMRLERERMHYEQWAKTGKEPPLSPQAPAHEVEAYRAKKEMGEKAARQAGIRKYLIDAGYGTRQAVEDAMKKFPETSPEKHRQVAQYIEAGGDAPDDVKEIADAIVEDLGRMLGDEQAFAVPTSALHDPRLNYLTRVTTNYGSNWLRRLNPNARAEMLKKLEAHREARGIVGNQDRIADEMEKTLRRGPAEGKTFELGQVEKGTAEKLLKQLTPENRRWVEENGLVREFTAFDRVISTTHASQIQRVGMFQGLTIPELNDVFKSVGAKREVFNENPAAALMARKARHARAKAANEFYTRMAARLGDEVPETRGLKKDPVPNEPGIDVYRDPDGNFIGYGLAAQNETALAQGGKATMYSTLDVAKAIERTTRKLMDPAEVSELGAWYDRVTRTLKSYVTRPFMAYHMRNRFGNRIQSWLEDVPVFGSHYRTANRIAAGAPVDPVRLGDGTVLDDAGIRRELTDQGILGGGFYEYEFGAGKRKFDPTTKEKFDPRSPENILIRGAERISAGITAAPGQALSGVPEGATRMTAQTIEEIDRGGHYLYKRMQGFSPEEAGRSVKRSLFDYGEMNDFERSVLGRGVFFYQYTRNIIPLIASKLVETPRKIKQILQIGGGAGGPREGMPEHTPVWMREGLPVPIGKDEAGLPMVTYGFGTPVEAAFEPFTGFAEGMGRGLEKMLAQVNPLARIPLEMATDRSFFLGREIPEARKAPHWMGQLPEGLQEVLGIREIKSKAGKTTRWEADPYFLYALGASPLGRFSTTAGKAIDPRKGPISRALNVLTGIKTVSIDPDRARYFREKEVYEEIMGDLKRKGLVNESTGRYYITQAGKQSAEAEELQELLKLRPMATRQAQQPAATGPTFGPGQAPPGLF